jgi:hypothetical protein
MSDPKEMHLRRARQWDAFHEWERSRGETPLTLDERLDWYISAFELVRILPAAIPKDMDEKASRIREVRSRLKDLGRKKDV